MAVVTAFEMAAANPLITADMVEATEFPYLIQKYQIMGVPKIIINETTMFEGALAEQEFLAQVLQAVNEARQLQ
jgi:alkyl hydroperoxide reductase subunit AhpF